jgi:hypothetical protein
MSRSRAAVFTARISAVAGATAIVLALPFFGAASASAGEEPASPATTSGHDWNDSHPAGVAGHDWNDGYFWNDGCPVGAEIDHDGEAGTNGHDWND